MKSLKQLPLSEREKATTKQLLEALEIAEAELSPFINSLSSESFMTLYNQLKQWNEQLKERKIDIFSGKDDKSFDRSFKYYMEMKDLLKMLRDIKAEMTVEEKAETEHQLSVEEGSILERNVLKNKK